MTGRPVIDLTGRRFGRLIVRYQVTNRSPACWLCACDCGEIKVIRGDALRRGFTRSCGCLSKEKNIKRGKQKKKYESPNEAQKSWRARNPNYQRKWRDKHPHYDRDWYRKQVMETRRIEALVNGVTG